MKAIVCTLYGSPEALKLEEVSKPVPSDSEVLVKVIASSVNWANVAGVTGKPLIARLMSGTLLRPSARTPGGDIAGVVEAVGKSVTQFKPGDRVFGDLADAGFGAFAEYVCVSENVIALKPSNMTFEDTAAAAQASVVALQGLRDEAGIMPGQKVLIVGASGGIGTFAVQIAKAFGAEVTAVCGPKNMDMVRSIGADHVIDYTKEDFSKSGKLYDVIIATAGYRSILDYKNALSPTGKYVATGGAMAQVFQPLILGPFMSKAGGQSFRTLTHKVSQKDLTVIKGLLEEKKIKPVIDRLYRLCDASKALAYYAEGHVRGKVVITMEHN